MNIRQAFSLVKEDLKKVEKTFGKYTLSEVELATRISNYILSSGGKRVRPVILILSSRMCGYSGDKLYPVACALEFLHTATLLHDDVVDGAVLRRGKKASNIVWGNKASVLTGDFVYAQVFNILVGTGDLEVLDTFSRATLSLITGEIFQLMKEKDTHITRDEYYYIIKNKTANLMSAATAVGGILGGRSEEEKDALKDFGRNLGMAFQIIDDALDYTAGEKKLGKSMLADLKEGKITLPLIRVLETGNMEDKKKLTKIIGSESHSDEDIETIKNLIGRYDAIDYTKKTAEEFAGKAVKKLEIFPECREKEALLAIADFVVTRSY